MTPREDEICLGAAVLKRMDQGFNTHVDYEGRTYHVQSQYADRNGPAVESMVFHGGQVLVRWTTSYQDIASRFGLTGDDVRHVVEQQHFDVVRMVRNGMLDGDDSPGPAATPDTAGGGVTGDPAEVDEPEVRELLAALDSQLDAVLRYERPSSCLSAPTPPDPEMAPSPAEPEHRAARPGPKRAPWWRRVLSSCRRG